MSSAIALRHIAIAIMNRVAKQAFLRSPFGRAIHDRPSFERNELGSFEAVGRPCPRSEERSVGVSVEPVAPGELADPRRSFFALRGRHRSTHTAPSPEARIIWGVWGCRPPHCRMNWGSGSRERPRSRKNGRCATPPGGRSSTRNLRPAFGFTERSIHFQGTHSDVAAHRAIHSSLWIEARCSH